MFTHTNHINFRTRDNRRAGSVTLHPIRKTELFKLYLTQKPAF